MIIKELHVKKWCFSERHSIEWNSDNPNQLNLCNASFIHVSELLDFILALKEAQDHIKAIQALQEIAK